MRWLLLGGLLAMLGSAVLVSVSRLTAAELKPGDPAPDFELVGSDGKTYKLSDFKGRQAVVLAWFPKAFTPGCTTECTSLARDAAKLKHYDVTYFTASVDPPEKNKQFAESIGAEYPILSDPAGQVARAYGVTDAVKRWASRWTFYIGKDGNILYIDRNVTPAGYAATVAARLDELGIPKRPAAGQ
jgi:peroxiredoxin Q/BCP